MSLILSQLIKKKLGSWNTRPHTLEDFYEICDVKGVEVEEQNIRKRGEYFVFDNVPRIIISSQMKDPMKHWIAFHELGHHLLHYPIPHSFSKGTVRKMDFEANFFASIALIPTSIVRELSTNELAGEHDFHRELVDIRIKYFEGWRI